MYMYIIIQTLFTLFSEDSSFLDVYEDKLVSEGVVNDEREESTGGESTRETKPSEETLRVLSKDHRLRLRLLTALSEHLEEVEKVGGVRGLPYMQVMLMYMYMYVCINYLLSTCITSDG